MAWLNANENPDGPPQSSIEAMIKVLPEGGRYHYQEFGEFYATLARSEDLTPEQILVGAGSSEVLHAAIDAFTSPTRPLITVEPTYEGPVDIAARGLGRTVLRTRLEPPYVPDVKKLVEEAGKSGGGLIYLCNPNNPTSTVAPKKDVAWMIDNLPPNTVVADRRGLLAFRRLARFRKRARLRAAGQECRGDAHILEDLRHGRIARGLRLRAAGADRQNGAIPQQRDLNCHGARGAGGARPNRRRCCPSGARNSSVSAAICVPGCAIAAFPTSSRKPTS